MDEAGASALLSTLKTDTGLQMLSWSGNVRRTAGASHKLACLLAATTTLGLRAL